MGTREVAADGGFQLARRIHAGDFGKEGVSVDDEGIEVGGGVWRSGVLHPFIHAFIHSFIQIVRKKE